MPCSRTSALDVVVLLLASVAVVETTVAQNAPANRAVFDSVKMVKEQYNALGKQLVAIVSDTKQRAEDRSEAVRSLVDLKYVPAIEVLIKHIDLVDPTVTSISGAFIQNRPCALALIEFGAIAHSQIISAYLAEPDPVERSSGVKDQRRYLLRCAIGSRASLQVADVYFQGLVAKRDPRISAAKKRHWENMLAN
ncbi:MAG: hypothetical protein NT013_15755 [Planctomycetia bacterium]|nr:hypothetical protein [Planctomycetia bacterium]